MTLRLNDFECNKCKNVTERITEPDEVPSCPECGGVTKKLPPIFRVNMGPVPITGYYDDNLQTFIRTKRHRQEVMDRQGVSERGETPKNGTVWV